VNGWWLRAAGAGRQCAPAALMGRSGRPLNFSVRRPADRLSRSMDSVPQVTPGVV
jgi:hypothetical protein